MSNRRTENPHLARGQGEDKTQNGGCWHFEHERIYPQDGAGQNLYQAEPKGCAPAYCHAPALFR